EVCDVAQAAGHTQSPNLVEQMLATTRAMPAYKSSMALDYENGRPMEIEAILGNTVRAARKLGVATPNLDAIYALAKMVAGKCRRTSRISSSRAPWAAAARCAARYPPRATSSRPN